MAGMGLLEALARTDLDVLLEQIRSSYRPGAFDTLAAADPAWRAALDEAEREVGDLYQSLCEADAVLGDWRRAITALGALWRRVQAAAPTHPGTSVPAALEEVA